MACYHRTTASGVSWSASSRPDVSPAHSISVALGRSVFPGIQVRHTSTKGEMSAILRSAGFSEIPLRDLDAFESAEHFMATLNRVVCQFVDVDGKVIHNWKEKTPPSILTVNGMRLTRAATDSQKPDFAGTGGIIFIYKDVNNNRYALKFGKNEDFNNECKMATWIHKLYKEAIGIASNDGVHRFVPFLPSFEIKIELNDRYSSKGMLQYAGEESALARSRATRKTAYLNDDYQTLFSESRKLMHSSTLSLIALLHNKNGTILFDVKLANLVVMNIAKKGENQSDRFYTIDLGTTTDCAFNPSSENWIQLISTYVPPGIFKALLDPGKRKFSDLQEPMKLLMATPYSVWLEEVPEEVKRARFCVYMAFGCNVCLYYAYLASSLVTPYEWTNVGGSTSEDENGNKTTTPPDDTWKEDNAKLGDLETNFKPLWLRHHMTATDLDVHCAFVVLVEQFDTWILDSVDNKYETVRGIHEVYESFLKKTLKIFDSPDDIKRTLDAEGNAATENLDRNPSDNANTPDNAPTMMELDTPSGDL